MSAHSTKQKILERVQAHDHNHKPQMIDPFALETDKKNQFLIFFKPETFLGRDSYKIEHVLNLAFDKFSEHGVELQGAALFPGLSIAEQAIMDRHYGVINHLSKHASESLTDEEKQQVREMLGATTDHEILGGHEILETLDITPQELDEIWLAAPSTKIRSGFYARLMRLGDRELILINAFHPKQLVHYTDEDRHTVVMVGHSDSSWRQLREEMIGDTFPDRAVETSIRGALNRKAHDYGFDSVTINNNVVHFSAGPTEALFEIDNFLGKPFDIDIIRDNAKLAKELKVQGIMDELIRGVLSDKELHNEAELKDTPEVVEIIKRRFLKR